jgi:phosphoribosylformimino-5-aminoimidazole carboxamide ribonucleotide (ProFAR) isomerase
MIASGGVQGLDDVRQLAETGVIEGVVIGMALYEGRLTLREALGVAGGHNAG